MRQSRRSLRCEHGGEGGTRPLSRALLQCSVLEQDVACFTLLQCSVLEQDVLCGAGSTHAITQNTHTIDLDLLYILTNYMLHIFVPRFRVMIQ